ncbi:MAG: hypothetical protein WCS43_00025 [Verrucomicrobiota bacterium]
MNFQAVASSSTPRLPRWHFPAYQGYVNPFMHGHPTPDELSAGLVKSYAYLKDCHTRATD